MRPSLSRADEQLDPWKQLANTPPPQSTTPGLHPVSIHQVTPPDYSLLLIYRPRKDERLSWPSWLTCSGRFTHRWSTFSCRSSAGQGKFAGLECVDKTPNPAKTVQRPGSSQTCCSAPSEPPASGIIGSRFVASEKREQRGERDIREEERRQGGIDPACGQNSQKILSAYIG